MTNISDHQFYLFLNKNYNWQSNADANEDDIVSKNEFINYVNLNWDENTLGIMPDNSNDIIADFFSKMLDKENSGATEDMVWNSNGLKVSNKNHLTSSEIDAANETIEAYEAVQNLINSIKKQLPTDLNRYTNQKPGALVADAVTEKLDEHLKNNGTVSSFTLTETEQKTIAAKITADAYANSEKLRKDILNELNNDNSPAYPHFAGHDIANDEILTNYLEDIIKTELANWVGTSANIKNEIIAKIRDYLNGEAKTDNNNPVVNYDLVELGIINTLKTNPKTIDGFAYNDYKAIYDQMYEDYAKAVSSNANNHTTTEITNLANDFTKWADIETFKAAKHELLLEVAGETFDKLKKEIFESGEDGLGPEYITALDNGHIDFDKIKDGMYAAIEKGTLNIDFADKSLSKVNDETAIFFYMKTEIIKQMHENDSYGYASAETIEQLDTAYINNIRHIIYAAGDYESIWLNDDGSIKDRAYQYRKYDTKITQEEKLTYYKDALKKYCENLIRLDKDYGKEAVTNILSSNYESAINNLKTTAEVDTKKAAVRAEYISLQKEAPATDGADGAGGASGAGGAGGADGAGGTSGTGGNSTTLEIKDIKKADPTITHSSSSNYYDENGNNITSVKFSDLYNAQNIIKLCSFNKDWETVKTNAKNAVTAFIEDITSTLIKEYPSYEEVFEDAEITTINFYTAAINTIGTFAAKQKSESRDVTFTYTDSDGNKQEYTGKYVHTRYDYESSAKAVKKARNLDTGSTGLEIASSYNKDDTHMIYLNTRVLLDHFFNFAGIKP